MSRPENVDVIVIGGGSAAFESAVAARQSGAERVLMLEKAPEEHAGGNARFSHTGFRFVVHDAAEIRTFIPEVAEAFFKTMRVMPYIRDDFLADLNRVTQGCIDPVLADFLVDQSNRAVHWMRETGIKWVPEKAVVVDGKRYFHPGKIIQPMGGGKGQLEQWRRIAESLGIDIRFQSKVTALHGNHRRIDGVQVTTPDDVYDLIGRATIVCSGGFQANPEMRARYLGPNADFVKVRGSRYNTGEVLRMLLDKGAKAAGHWQGAHASPIDVNAPAVETPIMKDGLGNTMNRYDYTFGITVNASGQRFYDEGETYHTYTYAKTGRAVLAQPGGIAYQIYDAKGIAMFRHGPDYKATHEEAQTITELARKIGVTPEVLSHTIDQFNRAVRVDIPFDARKLDRKCTEGLAINKSNWAIPIDTPPFRAYPIACGITFTFGGIAVNTRAQVLNTEGDPIRGLYASGDIIGLFFHNYPSCTGQTRNVVFGLAAGRNAASKGN